jgi:hypothetical protein
MLAHEAQHRVVCRAQPSHVPYKRSFAHAPSCRHPLLKVDLPTEVSGQTAIRVDVAVVDTTVPAGRMMMQMLGAFAEYEREMVKERTQAGLKASRAQGHHGGRRPKFTQAQRAEILSMLAAGRSAAEVARCSRRTARRSAGSTLRRVKPRQSELSSSCYVRKFGRKSTDRVLGPVERSRFHSGSLAGPVS